MTTLCQNQQAALSSRLPQHHGILVDNGAYESMMNSNWMQDIDYSYRQQHGRYEMPDVLTDLSTPARVWHWSWSSTGRQMISMPIGNASYGTTSFQALVLPQGEVPALLGLRSKQERKCVLEIRRGKCHMWIAETWMTFKFRHETARKAQHCLQLREGKGGHFMLLCIAFFRSHLEADDEM